MRKLEINLYDSHIGIWQEDPNDPSFKEEVYGGLILLLRDRGWTAHKDPETKRNWASLSPNTRQAAKGNLRAHIQTAGRCVELEIWSSIARQDNRNGRRYDFDKFKRMPFLDQKSFILERSKLLSWLQDNFVTAIKDRSHEPKSADEKLAQKYDECTHTDPELGHPNWHADYNRKSADGRLLEHGEVVWFAGPDGRLRRGQAFYNLNNMWWVKVSPYELTNMACSRLFSNQPDDLRRKRNTRARRAKLESLISAAIARSDFLRAHELHLVLFGDQPVYRIWSRKKDAYYGPNCCGYSTDANRAGRYTCEEAESEVRRVPHVLSLVTPDGQHVRFDKAA
ncbi:hypothetical protein VWY34_15500 [Phaeobacter sp. JH20_02]|uniref:hypothetical protein n=1 Tax=Phaeobacter sp. JH20_02 TaxID=3112461 RepID=UPI003A8A2B46